ncbi:hypothetical protein BD413DRAFT_4673 [Trametes elegans]|nr:hypothetical protein BD413DRAFT_4673 [Trametes elegans]
MTAVGTFTDCRSWSALRVSPHMSMSERATRVWTNLRRRRHVTPHFSHTHTRNRSRSIRWPPQLAFSACYWRANADNGPHGTAELLWLATLNDREGTGRSRTPALNESRLRHGCMATAVPFLSHLRADCRRRLTLWRCRTRAHTRPLPSVPASPLIWLSGAHAR